MRAVSALVIRGETLHQRLLREARLAVQQTRLGAYSSARYGDTQHSMRRAFDLAVHEELHRRLKASGVEVES